ncbi:MAG: single-stranded-DNA-specific exonuclease RecJ [Clostridia bacterium]|nr:single-stranded-DNA-specific exonuclease RecJ [Clostridia bacterium]
MVKKWEYSKPAEEEVLEVAKENDISELLAKILVGRGLKKREEIQKYLYPKIEELNDPFLYNDMALAVDQILNACEKHEKITIYGDYDVDGITSTAVLEKFLTEVGADVHHYLPNRLEEGYGLNNGAIEKLASDGTKLIVTVDCGISAYEEVEYAKELGLKVIITDHHECPEKLPRALAVVDAKRADNTYPFEQLAGVGVTFKLIHAMAIKLGLDRKSYLKYLDIVALGTVADIVPLVDENRIIVNYGLILMKQTRNIGLRELMRVAGFSNIESTTISFGLAPRMNACGRMGRADLALSLLLTNSAEEAYQIALELNEINKQRQSVEKSILESAIQIIEQDKLYENDVIVVASENWHHGVIGIVASKIVELYYKPTILICLEDGVGKGSGRSIPGFDLHGALSKCEDLLLKFGGHEMAIGLSVLEEKLSAFYQRLLEIAKETNIKTLYPVVKVDAEITSKNATADIIKEIGIMQPYGEANPAPVFVYKNLKVDGVRLLSNDKHLKLVVKDGIQLFDAIAFNMGDKKYSIKIGDKVDILHSLEINNFNNIERVQFNVKDIKKSF